MRVHQSCRFHHRMNSGMRLTCAARPQDAALSACRLVALPLVVEVWFMVWIERWWVLQGNQS